MFVLTLNKNAVKRLGALAVCGALLAGTVYGVSRYSQVQSAAALPEGAPAAIETTQDIAAFFSGYGLQVDLANTTVDKVKVPRKWDDSFAAFNEVVKASGLDLSGCKGKTVEKWVTLCPGRSTGEETVSGVLLVYKQEPVGAYLLSQPSGEVTALTAPADGTSGADGGASSETAVPPLTEEEVAAGADFGTEAQAEAAAPADTGAEADAEAAAPADTGTEEGAEAAAPEVSMETADIWPTD